MWLDVSLTSHPLPTSPLSRTHLPRKRKDEEEEEEEEEFFFWRRRKRDECVKVFLQV